MDAAFGATDVPLPRKFINLLKRELGSFLLSILIGYFGIVFLFKNEAFALTEDQPIHFSGDKQIWDRKKNKVELLGHAAVNQTGETLIADSILLDLNSRILDARGNCVYMATESVIWGEEMHFNLDTRTGTVVAGRVSNDKFTLRADRINKLGPGRFQTHWGSYSTCKDCPQSWNFESEDMDAAVGGYAFLTNVTTRIKEAPALWLPYLVFPMKTRRESGVLFPHFTLSGINGFTFVLPYFWAINRSSDMTLSLGEYASKGHRLEWEGRYVLGGNSFGVDRFYYLSDRTFDVGPHRFAMDLTHNQGLLYGIDARLRFTEVSDNIYPFQYPLDVGAYAGEAFLRSNLILSRSFPGGSAYLSAARYRNLLNSTYANLGAQESQFDPSTVQVLPAAVISTYDRQLLGSDFVGGFTLGLTQFSRSAGSFDYDIHTRAYGTIDPNSPPAFTPGVDPIRKATRFSYNPLVYTALRPLDVVSVVPSLQYRGYFYSFGNQLGPQVSDLSRGYLLFQTDISTQLEKIYEYPDDPDYPRVKHLFRPLFTYSLIPWRQEDSSHPFISQIKTAQNNGITGYNFDNHDIVPYSYNQSGALYFVPLGHSLAYGFTSQWIRRKGSVELESATYENTVEWDAGQAINFLELSDSSATDPSNKHILTQFFTTLTFNFKKFTSQTSYYYNPDISASLGRNSFSSGLTYSLEKGMHQRVMVFDRSLALAYNYSKLTSTSNLVGSLNFSLSDYFLPSLAVSYGFDPNVLFSAAANIQLQSPSQCWKVVTGLTYTPGTQMSIAFELQLNLAGAGFGGVGEIANQVATSVTGS